MDASRQAQYDANTTGASMYLSFDSSICSAAYKTLGNTTNDHSISNMDYEDSTPENSQGLNQDSTLEALDSHAEFLEANKGKVEQQDSLPNRVLQQFNVVSSTPTKEQLLRSVEVVRGSSAERCIDLTRAFMDMEDKDKENTLPPSEVVLPYAKKTTLAMATKEENSRTCENTSYQKSAGYTSTASNMIIKTKQGENVPTTFTENKAAIILSQNNDTDAHSVLTSGYIKNERTLETITENKELSSLNPESILNIGRNGNEKIICTMVENEVLNNTNKKDVVESYENAAKLNSNENNGTIVNVAGNGVINKNDALNDKSADCEPSNYSENKKAETKKLANTAIGKNRRTSIATRPICEPDLLTNRPSRIATNTNKRLSVNDVGIKKNLEKEICTEIPNLMKKVLKIAESTTVVIDKTKTAVVFDKHKTISCNTKGRVSLLPSTLLQAEKRPFAYTQRMSVLVKTTLNSPARKIARRSCAIGGQQNFKSLAENILPPNSKRKSMLPIGKIANAANDVTKPTESTSKIVTKPATNATKPASTTIKPALATIVATKGVPPSRKSVYPTDKPRNELQKPSSVNPIIPASNTKVRQSVAGKPDISFACTVCGSKFSIKSLLDAHKRSHEGDGLPAFSKKSVSTTTSNAISTVSQANGANKCKYCDKKFALLRALHIHLLQNCPKIPPNEKRKLKFHEMDHVEKAHLPTFFHGNSSQTKGNSHEPVLPTANGLQHRSTSDLSSISVSSTDSLNGKRALAEITMIANNAAAAVDSLLPQDMAPPRTVKKSTAHTGVHRTPNKSVICHTCKISFKTIMDHIQHNMKVHFNNSDATKITEISEKRMQ